MTSRLWRNVFILTAPLQYSRYNQQAENWYIFFRQKGKLGLNHVKTHRGSYNMNDLFYWLSKQRFHDARLATDQQKMFFEFQFLQMGE